MPRPDDLVTLVLPWLDVLRETATVRWEESGTTALVCIEVCLWSAVNAANPHWASRLRESMQLVQLLAQIDPSGLHEAFVQGMTSVSSIPPSGQSEAHRTVLEFVVKPMNASQRHRVHPDTILKLMKPTKKAHSDSFHATRSRLYELLGQEHAIKPELVVEIRCDGTDGRGNLEYADVLVARLAALFKHERTDLAMATDAVCPVRMRLRFPDVNIPLYSSDVETIRRIHRTRCIAVECGKITLQPSHIKCAIDELCEVLEVVLRNSPQAGVDIVGGRDFPGSKKIESLILDAVSACDCDFNKLAVWRPDPDFGRVEDEDDDFFVEFARKVVRGPRRSVIKALEYHCFGRCKSTDLPVFPSSTTSHDSIPFEAISINLCDLPRWSCHLIEHVADPRTKVITIGFQFGSTNLHDEEELNTIDGMNPLARVLGLIPQVEVLDLDHQIMESFSFFTRAFQQMWPRCLRELSIRDSRVFPYVDDACGDFIAAFADTSCGPGATLEVLRFKPAASVWAGSYTFDESTVHAVEQMLRSNRVLRELELLVREDVPAEAVEALLAHSGDVVRPPVEMRVRDQQRCLAFLSAIEYSAESSPLKKMDSLLLRLIYSFSRSCGKRLVRVRTRPVYVVD